MSKAYLLYLAIFSLALSSCTVERLKFWEKQGASVPIPFQISGLNEEQEQIEPYLSAAIKHKLVTEDEALSSDQLLYQARSVQSDVIKAMHAKGYYNGALDISVNEGQALFEFSPGERTTITEISIAPAHYQNDLGEIALKVGDPLDAKSVLKAQAAIYKELQDKSCAYDLNVTHQVILNPAMTRAKVIFNIKQGEPASFGPLTYTGNETVKASYLDKLARWEEGGCFKKKQLDALRSKMLSSQLFSRADPAIPEGAQESDVIPVNVALKERPHRTLKAGVSYYTDEELGLSLGWEHRNFFGEGERVNADINLSALEQELATTFNKPYFLREDQNLSLKATLKREDTDAYDSFSLESGFAISRDVTERLTVNLGADVELTHVKEDDGDSDDYALLSPMAEATYDTRDDALDPHKGALIKVSATPTIDIIGTSDPYVTTKASAQSYYEAHERVVLAGRANLGTIVGASTLDLPASERFYAGGGGSVRGFGYQEIGPFENGDPIGGRSLFESSLELRIKATDKLGAVAFVDAGQVDDEITPSFDDLAIGAGAGLRYYTDFGPLRFDVGVPLRGDENSDDNFQIYISIGQAF